MRKDLMSDNSESVRLPRVAKQPVSGPVAGDGGARGGLLPHGTTGLFRVFDLSSGSGGTYKRSNRAGIRGQSGCIDLLEVMRFKTLKLSGIGLAIAAAIAGHSLPSLAGVQQEVLTFTPTSLPTSTPQFAADDLLKTLSIPKFDNSHRDLVSVVLKVEVDFTASVTINGIVTPSGLPVPYTYERSLSLAVGFPPPATDTLPPGLPNGDGIINPMPTPFSWSGSAAGTSDSPGSIVIPDTTISGWDQYTVPTLDPAVRTLYAGAGNWEMAFRSIFPAGDPSDLGGFKTYNTPIESALAKLTVTVTYLFIPEAATVWAGVALISLAGCWRWRALRRGGAA